MCEMIQRCTVEKESKIHILSYTVTCKERQLLQKKKMLLLLFISFLRYTQLYVVD